MNPQVSPLPDPPSSPQVQIVVSRLHNLTKELNEAVDRLRSRLSSVLRQLPKAEEVTLQPRELLVPLADELRVAADDSQRAIRSLNDIIESVELPFVDNIEHQPSTIRHHS